MHILIRFQYLIYTNNTITWLKFISCCLLADINYMKWFHYVVFIHKYFVCSITLCFWHFHFTVVPFFSQIFCFLLSCLAFKILILHVMENVILDWLWLTSILVVFSIFKHFLQMKWFFLYDCIILHCIYMSHFCPFISW
jgi:hypothetical protein